MHVTFKRTVTFYNYDVVTAFLPSKFMYDIHLILYSEIIYLECILIIFIRYSQLMPVLMPVLWRTKNPDPQSGTCICVYIHILLLC